MAKNKGFRAFFLLFAFWRTEAVKKIFRGGLMCPDYRQNCLIVRLKFYETDVQEKLICMHATTARMKRRIARLVGHVICSGSPMVVEIIPTAEPLKGTAKRACQGRLAVCDRDP